MKKIVALVLSLVMVLGLATTAFGAITLWGENTKTVDCDVFDAAYNTKLNDDAAPVKVTYDPGTALEFNLDGSVKTTGEIPHYEIGNANFVLVSGVPADATAAEVAKYFLVKAHNPLIAKGEKVATSQTAADAYYILKQVDAVKYETTAEEFTAWSKDCEAYPAPLNAATVDYYTVANKTATLTSTAVKYAAAATATDAVSAVNALVGGEVVTLTTTTVSATKHAWVASAWDAKKVPTEYTCVNCKTVGTVVNSSLNAPAGAKLDNFAGTLIAYNFPVVEAPAGDKVESAETFDAGIAMYVGMSVMAAAGSAVVLKKKD